MALSKAPNCSVVIPTKRLDQLTKIAIREIQKRYNVPIIIVIDELPPTEMDNVQFLRSESSNLSAKRNQGVDWCATTYVAFLDSDAYPGDGWLESATDFLEQHSEAGLVGGPNLQHCKTTEPQNTQYLASKSLLLNSEPNLVKDNSRPIRKRTIASSNMIFRKSDYIAVSGMNENIFTGEDIELCYRFIKRGKINYFLPNAVVHHKQRAFQGFLWQRFVWGRGTFTVIKHTGAFYLQSLVPLFFVTALTLSIFFSLSAFLWGVCLYLVICFLESARVSDRLSDFPKVFPYVSTSLLALGVGALYAIVGGDIDNDYSRYRNSD